MYVSGVRGKERKGCWCWEHHRAVINTIHAWAMIIPLPWATPPLRFAEMGCRCDDLLSVFWSHEAGCSPRREGSYSRERVCLHASFSTSREKREIGAGLVRPGVMESWMMERGREGIVVIAKCLCAFADIYRQRERFFLPPPLLFFP